MLVHLLGLLDLVSAAFILLGHFSLVKVPLLYVALYLFVKLIFFRNWMSFVDAAAGLYSVLVFFGFASGLTWLFMVYFLYKTSVWLFMTLAQ